MKSISNKLTSISKDAEQFAKYSDLLALVINQPPKQGATIKDMRRDIKLLDILEEAEEFIELPEADFKHLIGLVENFQWAFKHKELIQFEDDLLAYA